MNQIAPKTEVLLPQLPSNVLPGLNALTQSLGIPREALAAQEDIEYAWRDLPRELREIPEELRDELVARMCVAVSAGLFDGAMNYIWNASVLQLRQKIRNFGLAVVGQIQQKTFEENNLLELQDSRLLELCLKLNIIDEDGYFLLDQCRGVRNNFSAAHPTIGNINDREFTVFLNRCVRYALADSSSPRGVDIYQFISAIKGARFIPQQRELWVKRLSDTHDAQCQLLINTVHGIYCDPGTAEPARLNAIEICQGLLPRFTNSSKSDLINTHAEYVAKGLEEKHTASLQFFERLGLIALLDQGEQHVIFSRAVDRLWHAHCGMSNFYNEPPFAERLSEMSAQGAIPDTAHDSFVLTVACCRVGNGYGVSHAAIPFYDEMIKGFSPKEIVTLIRRSQDGTSPLSRRINNDATCRNNFKELLLLIDQASIPSVVRADYARMIK